MRAGGARLLVEGAVVAGRYRVVELLGEGGMGQVWRGEDLRLERPVAVKVLQPHLMDGSAREKAMSRFEREGRAAARLAHPNIAMVYDVGDHDGRPYLVLEYLSGPDLKSLLDRHPGGLPVEQVLKFGAQAADGLAAAHAAGIVHRDVKPHNLMLTADGTVKVCDFGIARLRGATTSLTGDTAIGTMAYMAPEQLLGQPVDHRADLYALGATVFQLATGRHVFTGEDVRSVIAQHLAAPPPPARTLRADTPARLDSCLQDLLAKEPDQRPPDAATVAEHLHDLRRRFVPMPADTPGPGNSPPGHPPNNPPTDPGRPGQTGGGHRAVAPRRAQRSRIALVAVVCLALLTGTGWITWNRLDDAQTSKPPSSKPSAAARSGGASPGSGGASASPSGESASQAPALVLRVTGSPTQVIVRVPTNGEILFSGKMATGETRRFEEAPLQVVAADGGALEVVVHGDRQEPKPTGVRGVWDVPENP